MTSFPAWLTCPLPCAQIHDGFPTDSLMDNKEVRESYLIRYDSSGKLIDNYYDAVPSAITKISASPPKYRFKFDIALPDVSLGDLVAVSSLKIV